MWTITWLVITYIAVPYPITPPEPDEFGRPISTFNAVPAVACYKRIEKPMEKTFETEEEASAFLQRLQKAIEEQSTPVVIPGANYLENPEKSFKSSERH